MYFKIKNKLTGIILSGGKSIRMGENKAFIEIGGATLINRVHTLFQKLFEEIIIVTNQKELFLNLNSNIYVDLLPNRGVLGGIYTGLFFFLFQYAFCVACDMPFLNESVIQYLINGIQKEYDVIVPKTKDGLQPLHAIYSKSCLEPIKKIIDQGKFKIIDLYPEVKIKIIEEKEFYELDPMMKSFINVNTQEELLLIKKEIKNN